MMKDLTAQVEKAMKTNVAAAAELSQESSAFAKEVMDRNTKFTLGLVEQMMAETKALSACTSPMELFEAQTAVTKKVQEQMQQFVAESAEASKSFGEKVVAVSSAATKAK